MTADDQIRPAARAAQMLQRLRHPRRAARGLARRLSRGGAREAELAAAVGRLEDGLRHVRERHGEQIERLEDMVRELVRATESLRRARAQNDPPHPPPASTAADEGGN
jgi:hypothetical protein